jgi:hypothetical protein
MILGLAQHRAEGRKLPSANCPPAAALRLRQIRRIGTRALLSPDWRRHPDRQSHPARENLARGHHPVRQPRGSRQRLRLTAMGERNGSIAGRYIDRRRKAALAAALVVGAVNSIDFGQAEPAEARERCPASPICRWRRWCAHRLARQRPDPAATIGSIADHNGPAVNRCTAIADDKLAAGNGDCFGHSGRGAKSDAMAAATKRRRFISHLLRPAGPSSKSLTGRRFGIASHRTAARRRSTPFQGANRPKAGCRSTARQVGHLAGLQASGLVRNAQGLCGVEAQPFPSPLRRQC